MQKSTPSRKFKILKICAVLLAIIFLAYGAFKIYVNDYYHAGKAATKALASTSEVTVTQLDDDAYVFEPENPRAGLIFYPGGKVEYTAYSPLMKAFAENGILCVLVKMPYNLAVFDKNAADEYPDMYADIDRWYVGGHSLGGAMAASYVSDHTDEYEGLILLGAYSTVDLSDSGLNVFSLYGSEDGVLNMSKYEKNYDNLPSDLHELVIDGGCHSYFGDYGLQKGDGEPEILRKEQVEVTVDFVGNYIK